MHRVQLCMHRVQVQLCMHEETKHRVQLCIIRSSCGLRVCTNTTRSRTGRARGVRRGLRLGFAGARLGLRHRLRLWLWFRLGLRRGLRFGGFRCWVGLRCGLWVSWLWLRLRLVGLWRRFRLVRLRRRFRLVRPWWLRLWSDHRPRLRRIIIAGGGGRGHDD